MSKSKKRVNGEGSFYQRKDRTWVHQITLGRKPNGTLDRKAFSGRTQSECIQKKNDYLTDKAKQDTEIQSSISRDEQREAEAQRRGHSLESEINFGKAFLAWMNLYKVPPNVKPTTYGSYLDIYNAHLFEQFGEMMLFEITQDEIQEYYTKKQLDGARKDGKPGGLSAKSIKNHHMLLKDFFTYATKKYKLLVNPTEDTKRPEAQSTEVRVLANDEMSIFIEEVMKETQRVAILFGLMTGLRVGELLALNLSDLDLENQTIAVQRNVIRVKTVSISLDNPHIKVLDYNPERKTHLIIQDSPKTKTSNRVIPLSDDLCELVLRHVFTLEHAFWPNPSNLLFPSIKGSYIEPKNFQARLEAVSKRCEIKKVNPHALRHTFATRLVEQKVPLSIVKDLLGHSSITTTQRYTHKDTESERSAIDCLSGYINKSALENAPKLRFAKPRAKFADIPLPDFSKKVQTAS